MDVNTQAKNGFKTFIVTLSVSLVIFSAIYYFVTDASSNIDIESFGNSVADSEAVVEEDENVKGAKTNTVFSTLNEDTTMPEVLGGADTADTTGGTMETTESTVPDTGSETLAGTLMAVGFFGAAAYMIFVGPRKMALVNFENKVLEGMDNED